MLEIAGLIAEHRAGWQLLRPCRAQLQPSCLQQKGTLRCRPASTSPAMNSCASRRLPLAPPTPACASRGALPARSHLHRPSASGLCLSQASCRAFSDRTCRASSRALSDGSCRASCRALSDGNCSASVLVSAAARLRRSPTGRPPVPCGRVAGGLALLHFADDPLVDDDIAVGLTSLHCFRDTASLLVAGERHLFFAFSPRLRIRRHARHKALRADAGLDLEVWRAQEALFSIYRSVTDRAAGLTTRDSNQTAFNGTSRRPVRVRSSTDLSLHRRIELQPCSGCGSHCSLLETKPRAPGRCVSCQCALKGGSSRAVAERQGWDRSGKWSSVPGSRQAVSTLGRPFRSTGRAERGCHWPGFVIMPSARYVGSPPARAARAWPAAGERIWIFCSSW